MFELVVVGGEDVFEPAERDTATHLVHKEASSAPGFLHGLDVTILAGLLVTFGMLLVALRRRGDHDAPASDWIEHQFEDE